MGKKRRNNSKKKKVEFSKLLLIQESLLIWIHSIFILFLALYCISRGYDSSLPWLTAQAGLPWAAYAVSQSFYYTKAAKENTKNGIVYESALKDNSNNNYHETDVF